MALKKRSLENIFNEISSKLKLAELSEKLKLNELATKLKLNELLVQLKDLALKLKLNEMVTKLNELAIRLKLNEIGDRLNELALKLKLYDYKDKAIIYSSVKLDIILTKIQEILKDQNLMDDTETEDRNRIILLTFGAFITILIGVLIVVRLFCNILYNKFIHTHQHRHNFHHHHHHHKYINHSKNSNTYKKEN